MVYKIFHSSQFVRAAQRLLHVQQKFLALLKAAWIGFRRFFLGLGNGQIDGLNRQTQRGEGRSKVLWISGRNVSQLRQLEVFLRDAQNIGLGDRRDRFLILEKEI